MDRAAALTEADIERLIDKAAPRLQSTYLTLLEIGSAFGHKFKALIEFLGLTTLIITDLDSVIGPALADDADVVDPAIDPAGAHAGVEDGENSQAVANEDDVDEDDDDEEPADKPGTSCIAGHPGAGTSNQTLRQWLPKCTTVAALWGADDEQKIQPREVDSDALVRVVYQCPVEVTWDEETEALAGRGVCTRKSSLVSGYRAQASTAYPKKWRQGSGDAGHGDSQADQQ